MLDRLRMLVCAYVDLCARVLARACVCFRVLVCDEVCLCMLLLSVVAACPFRLLNMRMYLCEGTITAGCTRHRIVIIYTHRTAIIYI